MLFKSANVCVSENWYARQPVYSATLRRWGFVFFSPLSLESLEFSRNYSESFLFNQSHQELKFEVPMYVLVLQ